MLGLFSVFQKKNEIKNLVSIFEVTSFQNTGESDKYLITQIAIFQNMLYDAVWLIA